VAWFFFGRVHFFGGWGKEEEKIYLYIFLFFPFFIFCFIRGSNFFLVRSNFWWGVSKKLDFFLVGLKTIYCEVYFFWLGGGPIFFGGVHFFWGGCPKKFRVIEFPSYRVSKFPSFQGRELHVMAQTDIQTSRNPDMATLWPTRLRGAELVKRCSWT
jgi:hypothetical protein